MGAGDKGNERLERDKSQRNGGAALSSRKRTRGNLKRKLKMTPPIKCSVISVRQMRGKEGDAVNHGGGKREESETIYSCHFLARSIR